MDGPPPRQWPADEQKEEWCAADPRQTFRLNRLTHRVELAGAPERYQYDGEVGAGAGVWLLLAGCAGPEESFFGAPLLLADLSPRFQPFV